MPAGGDRPAAGRADRRDACGPGGRGLPQGREPVKVNRLIKEFVDSIEGEPMRGGVWTQGLDRPKRALYLSSPIGLGHAPATWRWWKAQAPPPGARGRLAGPGTQLRACSRRRASGSIRPVPGWPTSPAHGFRVDARHDLHYFQALRRMDEILVANFMVFQEVVEEGCTTS